ncbi:MAG: hypothetical protein QNI97_01515 [Desulfobacterales bacterium]|nr:hypothetical protein [Desulfobacterales bacterium]
MLTDIQSPLQGPFHRRVEPIFEAGRYEIDRKDKQHRGRQQGQGYKRYHQACPQVGANRAAAAIVDQFDQVAKNQEDKQKQQKQIDV